MKPSQGKRTNHLVETSRNEVDKRDILVIIGTSLNVVIFKTTARSKFFGDTGKSADEKRHSKTLAIQIPAIETPNIITNNSVG